MSESFQSSSTKFNPTFIHDHDYGSSINSGTSRQLSSSNCVLNNANSSTCEGNNLTDGKDGPWRVVPNKRISSGIISPQLKKPRQAQGVSLHNSFEALNDGEVMDNDDDSHPTIAKEMKPPPIFVPNISNIKSMVTSIESVISKEEYTYKCSNQNSVKLSPATVEAYRKLVRRLTELKVSFHTFQVKQDKSYRVVLKNMHYSTDISDITEAVENFGFKVRNITNARHFKTKSPLSMFFVDLEPSPNNKEIYNVQFLLNAKIVFEPPHKTKEVVQCKRCQNYGHTKSYCWHPHRCVKCGKNHDTLTCTKSKEEPPKCVLCGGNHPANYKGCSAYKEIKQKSFPPMRQKIASTNHVSQESEMPKQIPELETSPSTQPLTYRKTSTGGPTYAQVTSSAVDNRKSEEGHDLAQVVCNFFDKFEKLMLQQSQQIGTLMNLLSTLISKLK